LLRSSSYRVFLWLFSILLLGNLFTFVLRTVVFSKSRSSAFSVFVTNLSIADLLIGVYLAIVGVADQRYSRTYLHETIETCFKSLLV
jgi:hypothetical protein